MNNFWNEYKKIIILIILILGSFFIYTKLAGPIPFLVNSINTNKTDFFTANGSGEATAVPDEATVDFGVTQTATTVSEAQNKTNQIAKKVIDKIKSLGIAEKDIKTINYSVSPNYDSRPVMLDGAGSQKIVSYTVTQNLEVKVKPIDKVNNLIDQTVAQGANLVGGISFGFSDDLEKDLENKARAIAIQNAKAKAQSLASLAGIKLGSVINAVQSNGSSRIAPMAMKADSGTGSNQEPTNITPGEGKVSVTVTLYYQTY